LHDRLGAICDTEATDAQAHADQAALVESLGGREAVQAMSMPVGATPSPATQ
jgi:choline-sulfatase